LAYFNLKSGYTRGYTHTQHRTTVKYGGENAEKIYIFPSLLVPPAGVKYIRPFIQKKD
jgi:hypothetical protein